MVQVLHEVRSYEDAEVFLGNRKRKKIAHNTYVQREDNSDNIDIIFHDTAIVKYYPNGSFMVDSGGWKTVTTMNRINHFIPSPWALFSTKGVWYLQPLYPPSSPKAKYNFVELASYTFQDKMIIVPTKDDPYQFTIDLEVASPETWIKKEQVKEYAKEFVEKLFQGEIPLPSGGDCWICLFGEHERGHIESHIEEKYYVPSLLEKALDKRGSPISRQIALALMMQDEGIEFDAISSFGDFARDQIEKAILVHCLEQLGIPR